MSLRLLPLRKLAAAHQTGVRALSSTSAARAEHAHDDHHHHAYDDGSNETYAPADFSSNFWKYTFTLSALGLAAWALTRQTSAHAGQDEDEPFLTRYLAHNAPDQKHWADNGARLLELKKALAEDTLLFADAKRPRLYGIKNTGAFESASPYKIPVGSQADISNVEFKPDRI